MLAETRFAQSGTVSIGYQVFGAGSVDLVVAPGWVSNIDTLWEEPGVARFLQRLAMFSRVILFDKRGTGLSDRVPSAPTLEERMDDVRAVLDAVGSERAALLGFSEGGPMCMLFAATYPARSVALVVIGSYPRLLAADDYPFGRSASEQAAFVDQIKREWGGPVGLEARAPTRVGDPVFRQWWAKLLRTGASPSTVVQLLEANADIDIRSLLPSIQVPTLLLHSIGDRTVPIEASRYMAARIPGARLVEIDSIDHMPFTDPAEAILEEVEQFLTGTRVAGETERVISTIVFTDIVGSTELASKLGDARWRDLLEAHHRAVRHELAVHRGKEIKTTGDGFHATFDGPVRAIRCSRAILQALEPLQLSLRVGLHTGEVQMRGESAEGVAIHIAARVAALATAGQVLVSQTVRDLVAGSGLKFEFLGEHTFKGIADPWRVYAVV